MRASGLVTLTTDFGESDPYVGIVKGVLHGRAPELSAVVDLTHAVPPQDVRTAAFQLAQAWHWFPAGTLHVAVVDPGVGTNRAVLAAEREGRLFLAPDNGLLAPILGPTPSSGAPGTVRVRRVDVERFALPNASSTFHARDVFAPIAAALVGGLELDDLGPEAERWEGAAFPDPEVGPGGVWSGEVLLVDHFGNAITNLPGELVTEGSEAGRRVPWRLECGGAELDFFQTYAEVPRGEHLALVDSYGLIEAARRDGDAAASLGLAIGSPVQLRKTP